MSASGVLEWKPLPGTHSEGNALVPMKSGAMLVIGANALVAKGGHVWLSMGHPIVWRGRQCMVADT